MAILVTFDTETSIHNKTGNFEGSPHCPDNWAVYLGYAVGKKPVQIQKFSTLTEASGGVFLLPDLTKKYIFTGHNIKFDLLYARKHNWRVVDISSRSMPLWDFLMQNHIWDTMVAEYMLQGQRESLPSLDTVAVRYGGTVKESMIKEYWQAGISTENIDPEVVEPYLIGDVTNTRLIAEKQIQAMREQDMLQLAKTVFRFMLLTTEMEYNGLHVNLEWVSEYHKTVLAERDTLRQSIIDFLQSRLPEIPEGILNPDSPDHLSAVMFGGEIKYRIQKPLLDEAGNEVVFKSGQKAGQVRMRWEDHAIPVNLFRIKPLPQWQTKKGVSTGDDVVQALKDQDPFFQLLSDYRRVSKDFSTYVESKSGNAVAQLVFPDSKIHANINHAVTATMRTSSTNPNIQNLTNRTEFKKAFTSRFGDKGTLLEVDFSQLEIVCKAHCTQDRRFIEDVLSGVDFHCLRAAFAAESPAILGRPATYDDFIREVAAKNDEFVQARKRAKGVSFAKEYGAGAASISLDTGIPVDVVKQMFEKEEERYPAVKHYYENVQSLAEDNIVKNTHKIPLLRDRVKAVPYLDDYNQPVIVPANTAVYTSPFGAKLSFPQFQKFETKQLSISPTHIKNYPIQHFATMVVAVAGVRLLNAMVENQFFGGKVLAVNTIHDSYLFDLHLDMLQDFSKIVKEALENTPAELYNLFNIKFELPLKVDLEHGPNWKECKIEVKV